MLLFVDIFCIFHLKRVKNTIFFPKWLDHLLLMTSYLVTIATDSHQPYVTMCLRDIRTATENSRKTLWGVASPPSPLYARGLILWIGQLASAQRSGIFYSQLM